MGDLLAALQLQQTLSTSRSNACNLRLAQFNIDDRDVRHRTIGRHMALTITTLNRFYPYHLRI